MDKDSKLRKGHVLNIKDKMDEVSPTLCLAKWLQVTLHLHHGHTHSCHHPKTHKVPLEELRENPSALHNTEHKKHQRRLMLKGKQPSECNYCWKIENMNKGHVSDRMTKSASSWAYPHMDKVLEAKDTGNIDPSYLEVSFDPTCNFKCAYCSPEFSTKWMEEIKQHGGYPTSNNSNSVKNLQREERISILNRQENPYVEAFWKWFPDIYPTLHTFRITGGEPLLSKNTWKVLEMIDKNPNPNLSFAINTNLGVPDELINKLIDYAKRLDGKLKSFTIYTSCEATGKDAEYIRFGMNYDKFVNNVERVLSETNCNVSFMVTFNNLSVPSFFDFLETIRSFKVRYNKQKSRIVMFTNYINYPRYMCVRIIPEDIKLKFVADVKEYFKDKTRETTKVKWAYFMEEEIEQIERICNYMFTKDFDLERNQKDFALFFNEYDKRRGANFNDTFPIYKEFMSSCMTLYS